MKPKETEFVIVVDSREQKPLKFKRDTITKGLPTADYSIEGYEDTICIELKRVTDLIGTCDGAKRKGSPDSRRVVFRRELERMQSFQFYAIVIAGTESDVMYECEKLYKTQYKGYMAKKRRGIKCRPPLRPEVRHLSVMGSLRSFRCDFNAHWYFLKSEAKVAEWIEEQFEYFMRHKPKAGGDLLTKGE